eukprot:253311_1
MNRYRLAACILVGVLVVVFVYISFQDHEESSSSSSDSPSKKSKQRDENNEIKKEDSDDDEIKEDIDNDTIDEGVIKYNCEWIKDDIKFDAIEHLLQARNRLHGLGLIAIDKQTGIGFGNISQRIQKTDNFNKNVSDKVSFYITGSQTNLIDNNNMNETHFSIVNNYNIIENKLYCIGPIRASSESMTHATIYELNNNINCVVHIHNNKLWNICMNKLPTTNAKVRYGTPQMAKEVERLYAQYIKNNNDLSGIFVMGGHKDGLIAFGPSIEDATNLMVNIYKQYCSGSIYGDEIESSIESNNNDRQFKNINIIENYTPTRTAINDEKNGNGNSNGEFVHVDDTDPLVI